MKMKEQIEVEKNIPDGYYTYGSNGFIEYWEIKNNECVLNASISDNQITLIKNEAMITIHSAGHLLASTKISQSEFNYAIDNLKSRI